MRPVQQTLLSVSRKLRACVHALDGRADPVATASLAAALFALAFVLFIYSEFLHRPLAFLFGWLGWYGWFGLDCWFGGLVGLACLVGLVGFVCLSGWSGCLAGRLVGWLADWLVDWLVGWLAGWPVEATRSIG